MVKALKITVWIFSRLFLYNFIGSLMRIIEYLQKIFLIALFNCVKKKTKSGIIKIIRTQS